MATNSPPAIDFQALIGRLEKRDRDSFGVVNVPPAHSILNSIPFVHIRGLSAFWKTEGEPPLLNRLQDLLAALSSLGVPFHSLLIGHGGRVRCLVGLAVPNGDLLLRPLLASVLPSAYLPEAAVEKVGDALQGLGTLMHQGLITGIPSQATYESIPTPRTAAQSPPQKPLLLPGGGRPDQVERVIRGLHGKTWAWWLRALPVEGHEFTAELAAILNTVTLISRHTKRQYQEVTMEMTEKRQGESQGTNKSISDEIVDAQAEYARALYDRHQQRIDQAKAVGGWHVECRAMAADAQALERLLALLRVAFSGVDSTPEAIRAHLASEASGSQSPLTMLTTPELATLAQLPQQEFQGFRVGPFAKFDTDPGEIGRDDNVAIGDILDAERPTGVPFTLPLTDLAKHTLVVGMTGSGKTTTIFNLLYQLTTHGKPFLVIEPAKAEYRTLLQARDGTADSATLLPQLRIYTLGDETVAPFRLNPFEFDVIDYEHKVHLQTHIDYLKAAFNAAFILYAPMPYVLEMCLHEVYTDCGWDLASGQNVRLQPRDYAEIHKWPVFPTLGDLLLKIDEVVERLGYEDRIAMDVKAGLKARVGSLMLGSKGLMLNCRTGIPITELLRHSTVLELERIGNDDEKAFIIGLVLARLYEFRRLQVNAGGISAFRHVTVIEEAHRLLKNVSSDVPTDGVNVRGQAVETFTNMLSEIRSYGEGFLIAEQIPTKLTPDAIKNTNLKIIHRLVATDDREVIAGTANMSPEQSAYIGTLQPGIFAVASDRTDHPCLLSVDNVRRHYRPEPVSDSYVRSHMVPFRGVSPYEPAPGYWYHVTGNQPQLTTQVHEQALRVIESPQFWDSWAVLYTQLVYHPTSLTSAAFERFRKLALSVETIVSDLDRTMHCILVLALDRIMNQQGRTYRWPYRQQSELHNLFLAAMMKSFNDRHAEAVTLFANVARLYHTLTTVGEGPFPGCLSCRTRCHLRFHVASLAQRKIVRNEIVYMLNDAGDQGAAATDLARYGLAQVAEEFPFLPTAAHEAMALCVIAQTLHTLDFSVGFQRILTASMFGRSS